MAFELQFNSKELSNWYYMSLKLINFKMKDFGTMMQAHVDVCGDLQNLGKLCE